MGLILEKLKSVVDEIFDVVIFALLAWGYGRYRSFSKKHEQRKQELESLSNDNMLQLEETKQECEHLREALNKADVQSQEASQRIMELQSQLETTQQELEQIRRHPPMTDEEFLELCKSGYVRKVEVAITNGANVNAKDIWGRTALSLAAKHGRTETAKLLLEHGADAEAKDNQGYTALTLAAMNGHTATVKLLRRY